MKDHFWRISSKITGLSTSLLIMEFSLGTTDKQGASKFHLGWIGFFSQIMLFILGVILQPPSCPSLALIIGPFHFIGLDRGTILADLFTLKPSGWLIQIFISSLAHNGKAFIHLQVPKCSNFNKNSSTLKARSSTGIELHSAIFFKGKQTLNRTWSNYSKRSSLLVDQMTLQNRKKSLNWNL